MSRFRIPAVPILLSVLVLGVYAQVLGFGFVSLDDNSYVSGNPRVLSGLSAGNVAWAFRATHASNWHPLTWLSHMTDVQLFGADPGRHHGVSVLLHGVNAILLFLVLARMTGSAWRSGLAAALFAVHPLHVESVAWVAERKDVLSTFFFLLATGAYARYARRPTLRGYLPVALFHALGLMSKPMVVSFPFVLLLLDYWPLGRLAAAGAAGTPAPGRAAPRRLLIEKLPLLVLSAASGVVAWVAQSGGSSVVAGEQLPVGSRLSNAAVSCVLYLRKTVWPSDLAVFYPHPWANGGGLPAWQVAGAAAALAVLSACAVGQGRRRPWLAAGWLWYFGTLIPVVGLVQIGAQGMADRYTYIPLVGIFLAVAWAVPEPSGGRRPVARLAAAAAAAAILGCAVSARGQAAHWKDDVSLFGHAVSVTDNNWFAWNSLGVAYEAAGDRERALEAYRSAARFNEGFSLAWLNLGAAYGKLERFREARYALERAASLSPGEAGPWYNLGVTYNALGQPGLALEALTRADRLRPGDARTLYHLGLAHAMNGSREPLLDAVRRLRAVDPETADALALRTGLAWR